MHPDHFLLFHRQRTREAVARAEQLRHLRAARRDSRPRRAVRLLTRTTPRRADRASPIETCAAPDSGPLARGRRGVEPIVDEASSTMRHATLPIEQSVC